MNTTIEKVLIANRGEIAKRVAQAAALEGISTVGVYADSDFSAGYLDEVDEAYSLAGETPAETYLNQSKLIAIAKLANVDAVHPGYGFLAENADFANAVVDAGFAWIGPSGDVIDQLGNKLSARQVAKQVKAPLLPSTTEFISDAEEIRNFGRVHGYPLAIKAAYGGGGRGMRVIWNEGEAVAQWHSAQEESRKAFGRDECFVEVFLDKPRHVETQVIADAHGNVVVVGTRDCSLQRRHQKVIEEAPAPFLATDTEASLVEASRRIFQHVGYVGVGTVEFLIGSDMRTTFLEVNTRLQVEHTVTEEAYGIDLVREQFRIARGESLSLEADPQPIAHAFEFRINAEDPTKDFLPSQGRVTEWTPPVGDGVRMESDIRVGTNLASTFDSMLAKCIVTASTREKAIERASAALWNFRARGVATILPFHRDMLENPRFTCKDGADFSIYTQWIDREWSPDSMKLEPSELEEAPITPFEFETEIVEIEGRRLSIRAVKGVLSFAKPKAAKSRPRPKRRRSTQLSTDERAIIAPLQGEVSHVNVHEGSSVEEGDVIVVIEAMKMELPIHATAPSRVKDVLVNPGDAVGKGQLIVRLDRY